MEVKSTMEMNKCEECDKFGINLNYIISPFPGTPPKHLWLCSVCTAEHVKVFLRENENANNP